VVVPVAENEEIIGGTVSTPHPDDNVVNETFIGAEDELAEVSCATK
jgi:hypothetical protein